MAISVEMKKKLVSRVLENFANKENPDIILSVFMASLCQTDLNSFVVRETDTSFRISKLLCNIFDV